MGALGHRLRTPRALSTYAFRAVALEQARPDGKRKHTAGSAGEVLVMSGGTSIARSGLGILRLDNRHELTPGRMG